MRSTKISSENSCVRLLRSLTLMMSINYKNMKNLKKVLSVAIVGIAIGLHIMAVTVSASPVNSGVRIENSRVAAAAANNGKSPQTEGCWVICDHWFFYEN